MFQNFDELEDYPHFYSRDQISVTLLDTNETMQAWIYLIKSFKPELLKLPFITDYSSTGLHGLIYTEKSERFPGYSARDDVKTD